MENRISKVKITQLKKLLKFKHLKPISRSPTARGGGNSLRKQRNAAFPVSPKMIRKSGIGASPATVRSSKGGEFLISPPKNKLFSLTNELNNIPPDEVFFVIAEKERLENPKVEVLEIKIRKDKERQEQLRLKRIAEAKEKRE